MSLPRESSKNALAPAVGKRNLFLNTEESTFFLGVSHQIFRFKKCGTKIEHVCRGNTIVKILREYTSLTLERNVYS